MLCVPQHFVPMKKTLPKNRLKKQWICSLFGAFLLLSINANAQIAMDPVLLLDFNEAKIEREIRETGVPDMEVQGILFALKIQHLEKKLGLKTNIIPGDLQDPFMAPCNNIDYETGDLTGWVSSTGCNETASNYYYGGNNCTEANDCCPNIGRVSSGVLNPPLNTNNERHAIMSNAGGTDPCAGFPVNAPALPGGLYPQGNYSLRLGNSVPQGRAERAQQTFTVSPITNSFTYQYAVVLNDPGTGHSTPEKPYFEIFMSDQFGDTIPCSYYHVVSDNPTFNPSPLCGNNVRFMPWTTVTMDLTAYIGTDVTIRFSTGDCGQGGHYGYAYFNCECLPFEIIQYDTLCVGGTVELVAPPGGDTYLWNTGETTQSIWVSDGGTYDVTLTTPQGCPTTITHIVHEHQLPQPDFGYLDGCDLTVPFTDGSIHNTTGMASWDWTFGDPVSGANNTDGNPNPTHTFTEAGVYDVTLVVVNDEGCTDSITNSITVGAVPEPAFSSLPVCLNADSTQFTDLSTITGDVIASWNWNFGEPSSGNDNTSSAQNPSHMYSAAGTYNITLVVTSASGCVDSITGQAIVNPVPTAEFTFTEPCLGDQMDFTDQSTIATGAIVDWSWNFGEPSSAQNNISDDQNPSHTYATTGNFNVILTVLSDSGCQSSITYPVLVNPNPVASFTGEDVCQGQETCFTDASTLVSGTVTSWLWNFGDGNTSSSQNPCHVYSSAGTYTVTLLITTDKGCTDGDTINVEVWPIPTADFTMSPQPTTVLDPVITFADLSVGGDSGTWNFGDNEDTAYSPGVGPVHAYPNDNQVGGLYYTVTLDIVNQYGCPAIVAKPVIIDPYWTFYIPNAFTPNGDTDNETFYGKGVGIVEYEFWIFDRWGNQVFHCDIEGLPQDPLCHWDGRVQNAFVDGDLPAQQDVYVWLVMLKDVFEQKHRYIGHVTMVR